MKLEHKGWNWNEVTSTSWDQISEEFFPIAFDWKEKFHSVLDVGTGRGRHALFFAECGLDVSAVDLSQSGIEKVKDTAAKRNLTVDARVADMVKLPFDKAQFDCLVCFHTIYHLDYDGVKKALMEIQRVLKKGGEAYITFNAKENPNFIESESLDGYTMVKVEGLEKGIPHCYVNYSDLLSLLEDFEIISICKIQNFYRNGKEMTGIHYYAHVRSNK